MSVAILTESRNFDRTLEFTRDRVMAEVFDTVFNHSPLIAMLFGRLQNAQFGPVPMNGRAKEVLTGGESIRLRHNLGDNTTAKTLSGPWDTVDTTPSDTVRHSRINWKHYSATITLSDTDLLINRGPEEISSMVQFETQNALRSLAELAGEHGYDNGSVADRASGLEQLAGTGTLFGLNPATYPTFASRGLSARGTAPASVSFASGSFAAQGLDDMLNSYLNASEGAQQPMVGLTTYDVFRFFEGSLQPQQRYTNSDSATAMFENLAFKRAPVFPDDNATAQTLYWVNWDHAKAFILGGADLSVGPFERAEQQEARTSKVMLKWNMGVMDRRFVNKMNSITA
jgi:hypothetical protein